LKSKERKRLEIEREWEIKTTTKKEIKIDKCAHMH
jgi:hypothetical protein